MSVLPRRNASPSLLLAQDAVDGRAGRAGHLGELLLRQRDDRVAPGVERAQLGEPAEHPPLDRDVEGLEQELVLPPHLFGQEADQDLVDGGMLLPQALELGHVDGERLRLLERLHRRGSLHAFRHERHLPEAVAGAADPDRHRLPERGHDSDRETAFADQVQRVGGVFAVEDASFREKRLRRATESRRRTSSSGTPSMSRQRTRELWHARRWDPPPTGAQPLAPYVAY
jgi:hypothetical protein